MPYIHKMILLCCFVFVAITATASAAGLHSATYRPGVNVEVFWAGQWWATAVVAVLPHDMYRVHWGESVNGVRVHESNLRHSSTQRTAEAALDDLVEIYWADEWWPAVVLKQQGHEAYIHLEGMGNSWNQWVNKTSLRSRSKRSMTQSNERAQGASRLHCAY